MILLTHRVSGRGEPLLLLNGGLMTFLAWDAIASALADVVTVVRCDFRGQLLSPGPPPPTIDGHAEDVVALLDHLQMERVHVAGTSFGGFVAMALAAAHHERVLSLTVATAAAAVPPDLLEAGDAFRTAVHEAAAGGDAGRVMELLTPHAFSKGFLERNPDLAPQRRALVAALPRAYFAGLEGLLAALVGLDMRDRLADIRCPTLVLGAAEDATFPAELSRELAAAIPAAELEIVPGSGHALVAEVPEAFVAAVRGLLARVGQGVEP